jgi:hypothetical protein
MKPYKQDKERQKFCIAGGILSPGSHLCSGGKSMMSRAKKKKKQNTLTLLIA